MGYFSCILALDFLHIFTLQRCFKINYIYPPATPRIQYPMVTTFSYISENVPKIKYINNMSISLRSTVASFSSHELFYSVTLRSLAHLLGGVSWSSLQDLSRSISLKHSSSHPSRDVQSGSSLGHARTFDVVLTPVLCYLSCV